jgi:hypothetical protein
LDQVKPVTAAQKLARLQAARPAHECTLSRRGIDCMCADAAEFDVHTEDDFDEEYYVAHVDYPDVPLLVHGATTLPDAGRRVPALIVQDYRDGEPSRFGSRTEYADRFTAYPPQTAETVEFRQTRLYDREASQAMFVFGTTPDGDGVSFRYENDALDEVRAVSQHQLRSSSRYIALCRHYYTHVDLCPRCALDAQRVEQRAELIRQANEATPDPVAVSADDELIEKLRHVVDSYATTDPERWAIIATMFSGRHNVPPTATGLTFGDLRELLALVTRPKRLEFAPMTDAVRAGNVLGSGFGMMMERRADGTGNRVVPATAEDTHYLETRR